MDTNNEERQCGDTFILFGVFRFKLRNKFAIPVILGISILTDLALVASLVKLVSWYVFSVEITWFWASLTAVVIFLIENRNSSLIFWKE